ncbi:hypothetical protein [Nocardia alni]|uniref:hypothetical protein n=1 Tax=Nocardia alni TaxID=2815723 RepID=UPI001C22FCDA|nr:hypothetical protein [Nocardia alni]
MDSVSTAVKRGIAAGATVVIAAAVNVATGVLTQHWAIAWWAATAALVVVGAGLQAWLTIADRTKNEVGGDSHAAATVQQRVTASGYARVNQAGRDLTITEKPKDKH